MKNRFFKFAIVANLLAALIMPVTPGASAATLKPCTAIEKAQIANLSRQYYSLGDLRKSFQTKLSLAEVKYQSATATGNSSAAALARIDIQSAQEKINSFNRQMASVRAKQEAITKKCKYDSAAPVSSKKSPCSGSIKSILYVLANQYQFQQNLIKSYIEGIDAAEINYSSAISRGRSSDAQRYSLDVQKYQQDLQRASLQASLIKQEFSGYNSSCSGSGVALPADYVAPPDPSKPDPSKPLPEVCSNASCMPSTWGNNQSLTSVVGGPVRESANYSSDLMVYCSKPGTGSIGVTDARIVMAFTATTSWRQNYLSRPVENDFFQRDSFIADASSEMKYFDVPANPARYDTTPLASDYKKIQYIPATTLTRNICETNVPFIFDVDKRISPKIAGVGFFYLASMSNGRTFMVFLSGFDVQTFMKPRFSATLAYSADQVTYSGKAFGVVGVSGGRDPWSGTSPYFGAICFRIDGVEDQNRFPCQYFNSYWSDIATRNDFAGALNVSSLSAGSHTLEMYIPTAPDKEISTQKLTFTIAR
jgi:hypothetical protein